MLAAHRRTLRVSRFASRHRRPVWRPGTLSIACSARAASFLFFATSLDVYLFAVVAAGLGARGGFPI